MLAFLEWPRPTLDGDELGRDSVVAMSDFVTRLDTERVDRGGERDGGESFCSSLYISPTPPLPQTHLQ